MPQELLWIRRHPVPSARRKDICVCLAITGDIWQSHAQKSSTITVARYICDLCGHTHALLPSCIIPYRSYSLRFLLTVLRAYFIRTCPVEQICSRYGITVSTLYRFVQLFREQKALWLGVLEDAAVDGVNFIDLMDGTFVRDFFSAFCFSFAGPIPYRRMQQHSPH